jgi:ribosomal-protein-alanine N-acetyltransferase
MKTNIIFSTAQVDLVLPNAECAPNFHQYLANNREHFRHSSPKHIFDYPVEYWANLFSSCDDDFQQQKALTLFFCDKNDNQLIHGDLKFDGIMRGVFQACYLGYRLDKSKEGQGLMFQVLKTVIPYICENFKIHRIMSNYRVNNIRSGNLLDRLGFVKEGLAKEYLFLDGAWCDHVLTAYTNHDFVFE